MLATTQIKIPDDQDCEMCKGYTLKNGALYCKYFKKQLKVVDCITIPADECTQKLQSQNKEGKKQNDNSC